MTLLERIAGDWTGLRLNLFSGLTVALAMVPEAIAFSFVAGVEPLVGLYAAFFMVLLTSIFGGRPGMISGATGALAVVMVALVAEHGVEYLFAAVILMGALQLLFGALRLGKFIRLVPHPVMLGFVNGLAIVILLSQLESFHTHDGWLQGKQLAVMIGLTALAVGLIIGLPKLNGFEVAQGVREDDPDRAIYMIALSGYGRDEDIDQAKKAGFDEHVVKPPDIQRLLGLIRAAPKH